MSSHVIVIGDANVDLIVNFPRFLNNERQIVAYPTPSIHCGGTAANTAVALARLQVPTHFIGTIGNDSFGKFVLEDFTAEGVDTRQLFVDPGLNTVVVFAFVDEHGERYLWGWPRTSQAFSHIDIEKIDLEDVRRADWIHSTGMLLINNTSGRATVLKVLKEAFDAGVPTSLDLNLRVKGEKLVPEYHEAVLEAIQYSSVVLGSVDDEFPYLFPPLDGMQAARSLVTDRRSAVVRLGAGGSTLVSHAGEVTVPAFAVEVADTVGAGDIYNAGFIAASLRGLPGEDALRWGNAVAAYKISRTGARACPKYDELLEFLRSHPLANPL